MSTISALSGDKLAALKMDLTHPVTMSSISVSRMTETAQAGDCSKNKKANNIT